MNTTVNSTILRDASRLAGKVVSRSSLPILCHVRLFAHQQAVAITGTDLDQFITVMVPAHADTPGMVCVPSKRLTEVTSSSRGDDIELATKEDGWLVIQNGGTFRLPTLPATEFPVEPDLNGGESIVLSAGEIRNEALAMVVPDPGIEVMILRYDDWTSHLFRVGKLSVKLTTKNVKALKKHARQTSPASNA